jgi:serine O-acetyltransferase
MFPYKGKGYSGSLEIFFIFLDLCLDRGLSSLHIPINTCGKGLHIMHLGPILINGDVRTGENCVFHINTCIVAGGVRGVPVLGNNIIMGVGSVILGNVSVADGVAVGANAVVTKSVDERDIAVAGIPAHKVSNNGKSSWNKKT